MQLLHCQNSSCSHPRWSRPPSRGRPPLFCPACSGKSIDRFIDKVVCGDSQQLLQQLPDQCVDLVICSPPYFNQRKYTDKPEELGRELSPKEYLANLRNIFKECVRVTKMEGSIIFNIGDVYIDGSLSLLPWRFAMDAKNVKLINEVTWTKPNPTPKPSLKRMVPATEPFFHFVRSKSYKYFADRLTTRKVNTNENANIGMGYFSQIEQSELSSEQKDLAREELRLAIEEVRAGKLHSIRMKLKGIHKLGYGGQEGGRKTQWENKGFYVIKVPGNSMLKDYIELPVANQKGADHPAIYPIELVNRFIELTTDENDIVLDPFIGSGTTAIAARLLKRRYIGFDLSEKFVADANEALSAISVL